jgi:hypothetical protein
MLNPSRDICERLALTSPSLSASRSKPMNLAGVVPAGSATRLAAGWMRCWSAQEFSPPTPAMTICLSWHHETFTRLHTSA